MVHRKLDPQKAIASRKERKTNVSSEKNQCSFRFAHVRAQAKDEFFENQRRLIEAGMLTKEEADRATNLLQNGSRSIETNFIYLNGRVKYLEKKLTDLEAQRQPPTDSNDNATTTATPPSTTNAATTNATTNTVKPLNPLSANSTTTSTTSVRTQSSSSSKPSTPSTPSTSSSSLSSLSSSSSSSSSQSTPFGASNASTVDKPLKP